MNPVAFFTLALLQASVAVAAAGPTDPNVIEATCNEIAATVSRESQVYYLGPLYDKDIYHWSSSSTQQARCTFEPATSQDIGIALDIIGKNGCPFAIKGGGHATNPGFSSTVGVQIAMYKFSEITYYSTTQTVTIGAGLIWDDVYAALEPYDVNVAGARVTGVGVAGFTLGGGYSWVTNQHGLTIDTVQGYELVLPNGTIVDVTQSSNEDLFFALKGGYNNFGIVTRFTLKAFPQGEVWGGTIFYARTVIDQVTAATANFSANCMDPKAQLVTAYVYVAGIPSIIVILFYDGPTPPGGVFDTFLAIPFSLRDIGTRSFLSLVQSCPFNDTAGLRSVFNTIPILGYPVDVLETIISEVAHWNGVLLPSSGTFISYTAEPFLPTIFSHNTTPSAYPGSRERSVSPLNIWFGWTDSGADELMQNGIRTSAATLFKKAIELGQNIEGAPLYNNYAIFDTPLESIYGDNVETLRRIKERVDPNNVMGLSGGFKF
ncbi:hypothetical protein ID866_1733 [Astraeus odoratus]|nr:hypothetical protein ID866_1733 [Astraeus odoratus]